MIRLGMELNRTYRTNGVPSMYLFLCRQSRCYHVGYKECSSVASVELTETRNNATIQETITAIVRYVEIMEKGFFGLKSGGKSLGSLMLQLIAIIYGEHAVTGKLRKHIWSAHGIVVTLKHTT
ncbi:hypothetical protein Bca52824_064978 [Brassica carinata]|uniref:Uncharacterized protein n=1 Tax=Brassica carinata TaxID=52824 RepID=A0A8X7QMH1_BRACI|nr:hypothetical protein Bca52824_064978 [Brassica carinata]